MSDTPKTNDPLVAALLRERDGYSQRGLTDRVEQVDEQLRLRGHEVGKPAEEKEQQAEPPRERRTPPRRTAKG